MDHQQHLNKFYQKILDMTLALSSEEFGHVTLTVTSCGNRITVDLHCREVRQNRYCVRIEAEVPHNHAARWLSPDDIPLGAWKWHGANCMFVSCELTHKYKRRVQPQITAGHLAPSVFSKTHWSQSYPCLTTNINSNNCLLCGECFDEDGDEFDHGAYCCGGGDCQDALWRFVLTAYANWCFTELGLCKDVRCLIADFMTRE